MLLNYYFYLKKIRMIIDVENSLLKVRFCHFWQTVNHSLYSQNTTIIALLYVDFWLKTCNLFSYYHTKVQLNVCLICFVSLGLVIYNLDGQPKEYKRVEPPLKYQHRCIAIFKDKKTPAQPTGKSPCKIFFDRVPTSTTYQFFCASWAWNQIWI